MRIGGFQKLTLLDYPGQVACIVFTQGCDLRCPFCHNAGLVLPEQIGSPWTDSEIFSYLKKRQGILDGVVVTGGEPLLQADLPEFLKEIRAMGYKIKLDTNGSLPERLQNLLNEGLIDYAAMDVKHTPEKYELACGIPGSKIVSRIEESLKLLHACGIPFELRTTVVKGIHSPEDVLQIAEWIAGEQPYYLQSYVDSGHVIAPASLTAFTREELGGMLDAVRQYCPHAALRI